LAPLGDVKREQPRFTVPAKPPIGVIATVEVPLPPGLLIETAVPVTVKEPVGGAGAVTFTGPEPTLAGL